MATTSQKIILKASDGFEIAGDFYPVSGKSAPAVALSHMMPAAKESWKDFAEKLNQAGFHCLAIDLRGHGESQDGPVGFKNYDDKQHQASIKDLEAAISFLVQAGIILDKIALAGASIGANLSLQVQAEHPEIKASVLLSPGLNYKGIETERLAEELKENQAVFLAAGGEDDQYSSETAVKLHSLIKNGNKQLKIFENAGHGTDIFKKEPHLMDEIAQWLKEIYFVPSAVRTVTSGSGLGQS